MRVFDFTNGKKEYEVHKIRHCGTKIYPEHAFIVGIYLEDCDIIKCITTEDISERIKNDRIQIKKDTYFKAFHINVKRNNVEMNQEVFNGLQYVDR